MLKARKNVRVNDALRIDHGNIGSGARLASHATRPAIRYEIAGMIVSLRWGRCRPEQELMRRVTIPLVGLEHIVCPTIGLDEIEIRLHCTRGIIDITKLRFGWAALRAFCAFYVCSSVHRARAGSGLVAHCEEGSMIMSKIITKAELDGPRIGRAGAVDPSRRLNVVLPGPWIGAAHAWGCAQSIEQVVRRAVFLDDEIMCWKAVIWAEAGVVRQSAASAKAISFFTDFSPSFSPRVKTRLTMC
jgi:hypothetical protein